MLSQNTEIMVGYILQEEDTFDMDMLHIETDITSYVISGKTVKYVCRACLQNENNMLSIFSCNEHVHKTHAEILMAFTPINISENDGHSNYICSSCIEFIISMYTFQQQCIQVDAILRFASVNTSQDDEIDLDDTKNITIIKYDHSNELLNDTKIELDPKSESEESIVCEVCGDKLLNIESWNHHRENHQIENDSKIVKEEIHHQNISKYNICLFCAESFQSKQSLEYHQMKWHSEDVHNSTTEYNCEICKRIFSTRTALTQHCVTHNKNSIYECECGKRFKRYGSLVFHKRSLHSTIRPYQCNECGKTFAQNIVLKNHMLTHNGEKPYKCNYCEKRFRQKPHVQSHELIHTGGKPYHCLICGKQFRHQNTLIHHNRIHTGENPFHCPICSRGFYHSTNMRKHLVSHNKTR